MEHYGEIAVITFIILSIIAILIGNAFVSAKVGDLVVGSNGHLCCTLPLIILSVMYTANWYVKERDHERIISSQERMAKQQEKIAKGVEKGENIQVRCKKCKALNDEDADFCKKCGNRL
jgi:ribosomal protein L40E